MSVIRETKSIPPAALLIGGVAALYLVLVFIPQSFWVKLSILLFK